MQLDAVHADMESFAAADSVDALTALCRDKAGQPSGCLFILVYFVVLCLEALIGFGACVGSLGGVHGVNM